MTIWIQYDLNKKTPTSDKEAKAMSDSAYQRYRELDDEVTKLGGLSWMGTDSNLGRWKLKSQIVVWTHQFINFGFKTQADADRFTADFLTIDN